MKRFLIAASVAAVTITSFNTTALAEVGISVNIGQPNFYGQLDPSGYPQPQLIYRHPKAIGRVPINQPPVYMRVPPGHAKNWRKHCKKYNACDERVLFVRDNWYNREYAPRYQEQHGEHGNNNNGGHGRNR
ncbi:MAG: hypothetical protein CG439_941 [Methylococcaceae bacterium NSP1-2]|nr:hypothetical protein [Methylococcaceae bacterium]OYV19302.1 MAG: hypothetical protein CG439_941 [Methylococcaceae bacterium NSP1-2]